MPIHGYPGGVITANPVAPTASVATGVWTTEQQLQAVSQGNWPGYEYPISRSLRFNSADSAYLNRTPASAGNRTTWTWSGWIKFSKITGYQYIFGASSDNYANNFTLLQMDNAASTLTFYDYTSAYNFQLTPSMVFRDPSSWYHIVLTYDSNNATSSDRVRMYVNGSRITAFSTATYPTSGKTTILNSTVVHNHSTSSYPISGYLTEINFIDGLALDPSSFGLNDPETGVWSPKRYTGTYGTNGFYVNFSDNSNTTAATLGKDYSGNGNNWTPNNFSVTAGAGNDSLVDTPTPYGTDTGVGGEVRGNYCTWNPLDANKSSSSSTSNGNLDASPGTTGQRSPMGTLGVSSGKWYFEVVETNRFSDGYIGVCSVSTTSTAYPGASADSWTYYGGNGNKVNNGTSSAYGSSYTDNDVIGVALDMDNGKIWFRKNGTWQASGDPVAGTNAAFTNLSGYTVTPITGDDSTTTGGAPTFTLNAGQRPFAYTAPSGFKALCTQNLPTPTIGATSTTQADNYFNVVTRTFTAATAVITGLGFSPDWLWFKRRNTAASHSLYDRLRGTNARLLTNGTNAEITTTSAELTSFDSDGFTIGSDPGSISINSSNGDTGVVWCWKANGAGSTNTAGTITSTVSANTTSGFSIVTWAGTSINASTIGHGLGVAPSMIITKGRTNLTSWTVGIGGISGFGVNDYLSLNSTNAKLSSTTFYQAYGSSTFTVGVSALDEMNKTGNNYVSYCFAPVAGYSAFGSYTGNGSADGPFIYTGFKPAFILIKKTSATDNWYLLDNKRAGYNPATYLLYGNLSNAEYTGLLVDLLSNGFKPRDTDGGSNASGATYIYMALAENPFKYSLAR